MLIKASKTVVLMESHFSIDLNQVFVLREADAKTLVDLLTRIGAVEIRAYCVDDVERRFASTKELLGYDNAKPTAVRRLRFIAKSEDYQKRAEVDLSGTWWRGIQLEVEGRDDVVSRLRADLLRALAETRPWYSALYRVNFFLVLLAMPFVIWLAVAVPMAFRWIDTNDEGAQSARENVIIQLAVYATFGALLVLAFVLTRLRNSIFPRAAFLIGHGKKRFEHLERIQWAVVVAMAVSIGAGLIVSVLQFIVF